MFPSSRQLIRSLATHPLTRDELPNALLRGGQPLVRPGDLVYVRTGPGRDPVHAHETGETRAALVMVSGYENGDASVRLV